MALNIVSFQSNVVLGMVGHQVARRVYGKMAIPVTFFDTVYYSGIASSKSFGLVFEQKEWLDFYQKSLLLLAEKNKCQVLHTGFFGSGKQVELVRDLLEQEKITPQWVVIDPVMADNGKIYVRNDVADSMENLVAHADIITPNLTELEILSKTKVKNEEQGQKAAEQLLLQNSKMKAIVVTSFPAKEGHTAIGYFSRNSKYILTAKYFPKARFTGTGDLLTSVLCTQIAQGVAPEKATETAFALCWLIIKWSLESDCRELAIESYFSQALELFIKEEYWTFIEKKKL